MLVKCVCTCGKKLKIDEAQAGKPIRCTLCRKQLIVPTAEEAGAKHCDKCGTRLTPDTAFCYVCKRAAEGVDLASDKRSPDMLVRFNCACGNRMKAAEVFAGAPTKCPECRRELVIPTAQVVGHKFCKFCDAKLSSDAMICPDCEAKGRYDGPVAKEAAHQDEPARPPAGPAEPTGARAETPEPAAPPEPVKPLPAAAPTSPHVTATTVDMTIRFHCKCGEVLKADEKRVGETVKCSFCGLPNVVPSAEAAGQKYCAKCGKPVPPSLPVCPACETEQKPVAPTITAETEAIVRFRCGCGKRLKANAAASGKTTTCPRCRRVLAIPTAKELGEKYCARCNAVLSPNATKCPQCEMTRVPRLIWTWLTVWVAAAAFFIAVWLSAKWPMLDYGPGVNIAAFRRQKAAVQPVEAPAPGPEAPQAAQPPEGVPPKPVEPVPVKEPVPPKPPVEPQGPRMGTITVNTVPGGATVFLDDKASGITPPSGELSVNVQAGPHKVRVQKEGHKTEEKTITVEEGKSADLPIALAKEAEPEPAKPQPEPEPVKEPITEVALMIRCNLEGASVRVGDRDVGLTPKAGEAMKVTLKPGEYEIGIRKSGYVSWSKKVTLGAAKEVTETAALASLRAEIVNEKDGAQMALVPAGEFYMGNDAGADHVKPRHRVFLSAFYIDRYEVTNEQFEQFVKQTRYRSEARIPWDRYAGPGLERYPVRGVTWNDAAAYARWAGKRLPTEAEWEKAARGCTGQKFPWGNEYDPRKFHGNAALDTGPMPVGSFPEGHSPYGCEDMAGNVWEWCADWYASDYYSRSPRENPPGPTSWGRRKERVIRGGSWDHQSSIECYERSRFNASASNETIGFRCVKDVPE